MRFIIVFLLSFGFVVAAAEPLRAEGATIDKIYVVDVQRVLSESIAGKAAKNDLEADRKKRLAQLELERKKLQRIQADLSKQSALLSAEALAEKSEDLQKQELELRRKVQDQEEELTARNASTIKKLVDEIDVVIKDVSQEKGYKFVIEKGQRLVLFVDSEFDLTETVIKKLDVKRIS